jgi:hypothetical protein
MFFTGKIENRSSSIEIEDCVGIYCAENIKNPQVRAASAGAGPTAIMPI